MQSKFFHFFKGTFNDALKAGATIDHINFCTRRGCVHPLRKSSSSTTAIGRTAGICSRMSKSRTQHDNNRASFFVRQWSGTTAAAGSTNNADLEQEIEKSSSLMDLVPLDVLPFQRKNLRHSAMASSATMYHLYDGFVVLHGTDTMAYTASALSFMLENLGKTVILTGSQVPMFETLSDGRDNFIGALIMAGNFNIPEVTVFFNHKLLRGNRTTKSSTSKFDAFSSSNMRPLATVGIHIHGASSIA
ncbi:unnamed protein product, partial [Notodromas monacha]